MEIRTLHCIEGAKQARGFVVVIDVFRAFSLECYMFAGGCSNIYAVGNLNAAREMKRQHPEYILAGERHEKMVEGFDTGNSPTHALNIDFTGKTVIHTTSAGTQGLSNASQADEIITGSFVNAGAIISYIQKKQPGLVSLVCMGNSGITPTEEDTLLAKFIEMSLAGEKPDFEQMVEIIEHTSAQRFYMPEKQSYTPRSDVQFCLALNKFNFVIKAERYSEDILKMHTITEA